MILGNVGFSWRWEQFGGELGCFSHVSFDLHLSLHEGHLGVELSKADCFEVVISHSEGGIGFFWLLGFHFSLSILEVDCEYLLDLTSLGLLYFKSKDSCYLRDQGLSFSSLKEDFHHSKDNFCFKI